MPPPDESQGPSQPPAGQPPRGRGPQHRAKDWIFLLAILAGALVFIVIISVFGPSTSSSKTVSLTYSQFLSKVTDDHVKSVNINQGSGVIRGETTDGTTFSAQGPPGGLPAGDTQLLNAHHVARNYAGTTSSAWASALLLLVPFALIAILWISMSRRRQAGLSGWSKSQAKVHTGERPSTTFADIAGYEPVKQEISEVVEFLRDASRFSEVGARVPKGILLVGPPGTGKTLFARAIAGEAAVPFITVTGSEFMEMFVGVGAARVRDLFKTARQQKPCIIFIDEIDAIGRKRGTGLGGGHDEREQTLNQILSEMDGFDAMEGIIILAATNRPDILDPALLRAGRFDRQVVIPLPTVEERRAILNVHGRGKRMAPDVDLDTVARATPGMSGAELENLVNEAALGAVRRGGHAIGQADFEGARERVLLGLRRTSLALSDDEKHIVAYHEAGHAVLAHLLPHADPVHRVTILPTGMALGATQQLPTEERALHQLPYLQDAIAVRLGGRSAEETVFGVPSTGAENDLVSATELARRMVREWGMSEEIGTMSWAPRGPVFLGEDLLQTRDYSDETARIIDQEVSKLLRDQGVRARQTLEQHRAALDALAASLQTQETLEGAEVVRIIELADEHRPAADVTHLAHREARRRQPRNPVVVPDGDVTGGARTDPGDTSVPR
jgi:cell division protease FtsH